MFEIAYVTSAGKAEPNEDRVFVNGEIRSEGAGCVQANACLVAVCDGVGGEAFGAEAAQAACESLRVWCGLPLTEERAAACVTAANEAVCRLQEQDAAHSGTATVLAGLYADGESVCAFNVGDSEILRLRDGLLMRISERHCLADVRRALRLEITDPRMYDTVTRCLGGRNAAPYTIAFDPEPEDVYLLFSDGVGDVVTRSELKALLCTGQAPEALCGEICRLALEKGSQDNLSIIIVRRC